MINNYNTNNNNNSQVPIVQAFPVNSEPSAPALTPTVVYATQAVPPPTNDNDRYGVCRKCRRVFERRPGINDGQAQYYRCPECDSERIPDMILNSCVVC